MQGLVKNFTGNLPAAVNIHSGKSSISSEQPPGTHSLKSGSNFCIHVMTPNIAKLVPIIPYITSKLCSKFDDNPLNIFP